MTSNVLADASAILNIGHWKTFATKVVSHNAGDSSFKYFDQKHWGTANYKASHDLYYLGARLLLIHLYRVYVPCQCGLLEISITSPFYLGGACPFPPNHPTYATISSSLPTPKKPARSQTKRALLSFLPTDPLFLFPVFHLLTLYSSYH